MALVCFSLLRAILEVFYPAIQMTRYQVYRSKQKKLLLFQGLIWLAKAQDARWVESNGHKPNPLLLTTTTSYFEKKYFEVVATRSYYTKVRAVDRNAQTVG